MPMPDTAANSPDPRYAASVRLSVAPMMDWTDYAYISFSNNRLHRKRRIMLY